MSGFSDEVNQSFCSACTAFIVFCYVIAITWKGTKCFGNTCEEYPLDNTISFAFIIFLVATKENGAHRLVHFLSLFSRDNFF